MGEVGRRQPPKTTLSPKNIHCRWEGEKIRLLTLTTSPAPLSLFEFKRSRKKLTFTLLIVIAGSTAWPLRPVSCWPVYHFSVTKCNMIFLISACRQPPKNIRRRRLFFIRRHPLQVPSILQRIFSFTRLTSFPCFSKDQGEVKAHKIILAAQSEYFKVNTSSKTMKKEIN